MGRAMNYNKKQSRTLWILRELPPPWIDCAVDSIEFAELTGLFQKQEGLTIDGMMGPKTLDRIRHGVLLVATGSVLSHPESTAPDSALNEAFEVGYDAGIEAGIASCEQPVTAPDIDRETYKATKTRKRSGKPKSIVLHDSVTRTAKSCFAVLEKRDLSTHFLVDESGKIYECADPESRVALHASAWNSRSIGIDMINLLSTKYLKKKKGNKAESARVARIIKRNWSAIRTGKCVDYTEAQKASLVELVRYLCDRFDIPYKVPIELTTYGERIASIDAKKYTGVIAHGQTSSKRWDGLLAVEYLIEDGASEDA